MLKFVAIGRRKQFFLNMMRANIPFSLKRLRFLNCCNMPGMRPAQWESGDLDRLVVQVIQIIRDSIFSLDTTARRLRIAFIPRVSGGMLTRCILMIIQFQAIRNSLRVKFEWKTGLQRPTPPGQLLLRQNNSYRTMLKRLFFSTVRLRSRMSRCIHLLKR